MVICDVNMDCFYRFCCKVLPKEKSVRPPTPWLEEPVPDETHQETFPQETMSTGEIFNNFH